MINLSISKLISVKLIPYLMALITAVLVPLIPLIATIIILCFVDFFSGLWKSLKQCKDVKGFRAKLRCVSDTEIFKSGVKLVLYVVSILLVQLLAVVVFGSGLYIAAVILCFYGLVELKSIFSNFDYITDTDTFTLGFARIRRLFTKKIVNLIEKDED